MGGIVYAIFGVIEAIVALRFVFLLLGANPESAFVNLIYSLSSPLMAPFAGIFGSASTVPTGAVVQSVIDWAALVALLIYGLIAGVVARFLAGRRV
ncbi:YggT family protein [Candidatus Saccharibacteria bacterium]|nr:YggT family protein [Candidatus Saccharibacteria bacterium]